MRAPLRSHGADRRGSKETEMGKHAVVAHLGGILAAVSRLARSGLGRQCGGADSRPGGHGGRLCGALRSGEPRHRRSRSPARRSRLGAAAGDQTRRLRRGHGTRAAGGGASLPCRTAAVPRAAPAVIRLSRRPSGIEDVAVDQWWRELMPRHPCPRAARLRARLRAPHPRMPRRQLREQPNGAFFRCAACRAGCRWTPAR